VVNKANGVESNGTPKLRVVVNKANGVESNGTQKLSEGVIVKKQMKLKRTTCNNSEATLLIRVSTIEKKRNDGRIYNYLHKK